MRLADDLSARHREALVRFVQFWGDMASNWGINRTMAQIHALLYASERPLDTDQIMRLLGISRGNANMNLRSLIAWNLVRKTPLEGSRKDYFSAEKDVWEITTQIVRERETREIKPVMQQLEDCRTTLSRGDAPLHESEAVFMGRIESLMQLMDVFDGFSQVLIPLLQSRDAETMRRLVGFAASLNLPRAESPAIPKDE